MYLSLILIFLPSPVSSNSCIVDKFTLFEFSLQNFRKFVPLVKFDFFTVSMILPLFPHADIIGIVGRNPPSVALSFTVFELAFVEVLGEAKISIEKILDGVEKAPANALGLSFE